jgi:hypothetical protein
MQAFLISLAAKLFSIHPATASTKTFFVGLSQIASGIIAVCGLVAVNDPNVLHYVGAFGIPLLWGIATITHRDSITKLAQKLTDLNLSKIMLLGFVVFMFAAPRVEAVENLNKPLHYFLTPRMVPAGYTQTDTAYWIFKPTVTVPVLQLRQSSDASRKLDVSTMASAGGGLTYERDVMINGKNYSTMSVSVVELLATNPPGLNADFACALVFGMFNNVLQVGAGYDFGSVPSGHRVFFTTGFGVNLVQN